MLPSSLSRRWCFYHLLILSTVFGFFGTAIAEDLLNTPEISPINASQSNLSWQIKFKNQLINESKMDGHSGLSEKVDNSMNKLMQEIVEGSGHQTHISDGPYKEMSAMQQMDRSFFLGPGPSGESVNPGGHCPTG